MTDLTADPCPNHEGQRCPSPCHGPHRCMWDAKLGRTEDPRRITSPYPAMDDLERADAITAATTLSPHLQHRIDQIKARATELGMSPDRFDDLLDETAAQTARAFQNAPSTPQEPFSAEISSQELPHTLITVGTVCAAFVTGAVVGAWLTRGTLR